MIWPAFPFFKAPQARAVLNFMQFTIGPSVVQIWSHSTLELRGNETRVLHRVVKTNGQDTPLALSPQPSTLHPQPPTLNHQPPTISHQPSALNRHPSNFSPQPSTLNPQPSALDPQRSTLNPQPPNLSRQPSTLNPQPLPSIIELRIVVFSTVLDLRAATSHNCEAVPSRARIQGS